MLMNVEAGVLNVAYEESGTAAGTPVLLLHGFPYDVHAYEEVTALLVAAGCHVFSPYLRGYGPTHFLFADTPRSGQQAALAHDLLEFMNALEIESAVLAGYDWGGRAACVVAALWPERVRGLVSGGGYNIQDIAGSAKPLAPEYEHRLWYQYYFHSERGRAGLEQYRYDLCKLLWRLWSPSWHFEDATYDRTAGSFNNADFVAVVVHSYRHRFGLAHGDPEVEGTERRLAAHPTISVPAIALYGSDDGVMPVDRSKGYDRFLKAAHERRVISGAGHNLPQEAPQEFSEAVLSLI
jgi:pimeloyl-ACP methyl ester carboxylesterase